MGQQNKSSPGQAAQGKSNVGETLLAKSDQPPPPTGSPPENPEIEVNFKTPGCLIMPSTLIMNKLGKLVLEKMKVFTECTLPIQPTICWER